jgi:hypothetical protein
VRRREEKRKKGKAEGRKDIDVCTHIHYMHIQRPVSPISSSPGL